MRLDPWEPDIRTLMSRLEENEIDLQPDFQRGIAWNPQKQAKLVDTILRGWSVPPLHFLVYDDQTMAVLDGQQRLTSIQRFIEGQFPVAEFPPYDENINAMRGLLYAQLAPDAQRRINNYTIRSYRLHDYSPQEPHELFFRLNQPTGLTQAEKRNALMGSSRSQVRELVTFATALGWSKELIGFENSRLAYDDILARLCVHLQERTLRISTNAARLEQQFRLEDGFAPNILGRARASIELLTESLVRHGLSFGRLNKATLLSWLLFCARLIDINHYSFDMHGMISEVEDGRVRMRRGQDLNDRSPVATAYLRLYDDRASLRVSDILSVVARDVCLWRLAAMYEPSLLQDVAIDHLVRRLRPAEFGDPGNLESFVLALLDDPFTWGDL